MSLVDFRRFAPPERLRCIAPRNLRQLLTPYSAWLESRGFHIPPEDCTPDYAALSRLLGCPALDTPAELIDALFLIAEVSDGPNLDLLIGAAESAGLALLTGEGATGADIALQVYCHKPALLYQRHPTLTAGRQRTYECFRTRLLPALPPERPCEEILREMAGSLDVWFGRRSKGTATRIVCAESGAWLCLLICQGPGPGQEAGGGPDPSRPGFHDAVAYHRSTGELRVSGHTKEMRAVYARIFGRLVFGDESHFIAISTGYTLEPLRRNGRASLACLDVDGIERVTLKGLILDWGGRQSELENRAASDLFALYEEKGEAIPLQAHLRSATFEVKLSDSWYPRHVTIKPPNIIKVLRDGDGPPVEAWLKKRKFFLEEAVDNGVVHHEQVLAGA